MRHICETKKLEIRSVIKHFCKKGMPHQEIHEDFRETLGKESPSYSLSIDNLCVGEPVNNDYHSTELIRDRVLYIAYNLYLGLIR